jgi:hypothetical protein
MAEAAADKKAEEKAAKKDTSETTGDAVAVAAAALKRYTDEVESLRARADLAAKVIAGLGSTLVTAIGIAKFSDLFPMPPDITKEIILAIIGVTLGFTFMVAAVLFIALRYWKATEPIPLRSDLTRLEVEDDNERKLVIEAFDDVARLNDVPTLLAYEARAHRIERIARWLPKEEAGRAATEAAVIQTEVLATQYLARRRIVRRRVSMAVRGPGAKALYVVFVGGVILFGFGADYLASERTDAVAVAKACADARAVDENIDLPPICGEPAEEPPGEELTTPEQVNEARLDLLASAAACFEEAHADETLDASACQLLVDAATSLGGGATDGGG